MRPRVASVRVNFAPLTGWPDGSKTDPFREAIMVWPWPKAEAAPKIETIRTHSNTQSFAIRVEADIWTSSPCMAWPEPGPDNPLAGPRVFYIRRSNSFLDLDMPSDSEPHSRNCGVV